MTLHRYAFGMLFLGFIALHVAPPLQAQGLFDACEVEGNCVFNWAKELGYQPECDSIFDTNGNRSFYVPWQGGQCRSCPEGQPTVAGGCEIPAREEFSATTGRRQASGIFKTDCPGGYFLHRLSGVCYQCPSGYNRTAYDIGGGQACSRAVSAQKVESQFVHWLSCDKYYDDQLTELMHQGKVRRKDAAFSEAGKCWVCETVELPITDGQVVVHSVPVKLAERGYSASRIAQDKLVIPLKRSGKDINSGQACQGLIAK